MGSLSLTSLLFMPSIKAGLQKKMVSRNVKSQQNVGAALGGKLGFVCINNNRLTFT